VSKRGPQTVVATTARRRDRRAREVITVGRSCDLESCARLDMSGPPTTNDRSLLARLRVWYHVSVLRLLVKEARSLPERMGCALEMRTWELRGYTGLSRTRMGTLLAFESQSCKRADIRHMQQLQADHPFLSIVDRLLPGQAWKAGSEWDGRTGTLQIRIGDMATAQGLPRLPVTALNTQRSRRTSY
jgi:hypothetical protein